MTATTASGWHGPRVSFHGGHSALADGSGSVDQIAQAATDQQFLRFGFTEHFLAPDHRQYRPEPAADPDWHLDSQSVGLYVQAVQQAKERFAGRLSILLGAEVEYIRGQQEWTRRQTARWPFDYLLGSVHYVRYDGEDICIDYDRRRSQEALRRAGSPEQLHLDYYDHVLELLAWRLVHVVGHLDVIKLYLRPEREWPRTAAIRDKVQGVLETMRDQGVALDVNPRGLIKPCRSVYPADWILAEAARIGVAATLGDDSHGPDEVGARLDQAAAAMLRAGYRQMAIVRAGGELELTPLA